MNTRDPMQRLMDEARVLGESRMIRAEKHEDVTHDEARLVIHNVKHYMANNRVSQGSLAKAIGIGTSTVSQVLSESYVGNWKQIIFDMDRWLEERTKRDNAPKVAAFVKTRVAEEVATVADVACKLSGIGIVFGEPGIGKTLALRAIAEEKPGAVYYAVKSVATSPATLWRGIADAYGLPGLKSSQTANWWFNVVAKYIRGTNRLLIIDQVHKLCSGKVDASLYTLCDLLDETGCPQLWAGTIDLVNYLHRSEGKTGREPLAQIRRRISIASDLHARTFDKNGNPGGGEPLHSIDEIRAVFALNKLKLTSDGARFLTKLANTPGSGHLDEASKCVTMASILYGDEQSLNAQMLREAHRMLVGTREASRFEAMDTTMPAAMSAAG